MSRITSATAPAPSRAYSMGALLRDRSGAGLRSAHPAEPEARLNRDSNGAALNRFSRRDLLTGTAAGALALWASSRVANAQQATGAGRLTDKLAVVDGGGVNVLAFSTGDGLVLVDSGAPKSGDQLMAALKKVAAGAKVQTLFNTHYHIDQTANNEVFAAAGARIVAHLRTREWMSTD